MKFKLLTICLAIILTGEYSAYHQAIADRYSPFYRADIEIEMVKTLPTNCGLKFPDMAYGCYYYNKKTLEPIKIQIPLWNREYFYWSLNHEAQHWIFKDPNEPRTNKRTLDFINWIDNLI